ncbi:MAG TPA: DNA polymerase III subunit delta [Steroidobacteraceae bacterium]
MKLTSDTLPAHLTKPLLRSYLVSGDEPLLAAEAADAIRATARAAGFAQREVHFIERVADWDEVRGAVANLSLFASRRLLEIRLPSGKPGVAGSAALIDMIGANDPDTLFLILTAKLERDAQSAAWVKAIESVGAWVQVWPVDSNRLPAWLRARARRMGLDVSDEALELLAERTEGNLLAAHQELQKLGLLARDARLDADAVLQSVADNARFDVFRLGEAVLAGDTPRALRMLGGLRGEGVEPTLVLWALTKALRDLWGTTRPAAGQPARGWGRQAAALEQGARRAPQLAFDRLIVRAGRADRMIKGRLRGDAWDEMLLLAAELCGRRVVPTPAGVLP